MTDEQWMAAMWAFVRDQLPPAPAAVVELGCGRHGGFVPALLDAGYDAVGVDPNAPEGAAYRQLTFEAFEAPARVDAVIACTSLHHVEDAGEVTRRVASTLAPGGVVVVIEWAWERFDEATARWCFDRLAPLAADEHGWLHHHRDAWPASGKPWDSYVQDWAAEHGLHRGGAIVDALDAQFDRRVRADGPYFFGDLDGTTEADEQAAIDAGQIQPTGIRYAGTISSPR